MSGGRGVLKSTWNKGEGNRYLSGSICTSVEISTHISATQARGPFRAHTTPSTQTVVRRDKVQVSLELLKGNITTTKAHTLSPLTLPSGANTTNPPAWPSSIPLSSSACSTSTAWTTPSLSTAWPSPSMISVCTTWTRASGPAAPFRAASDPGTPPTDRDIVSSLLPARVAAAGLLSAAPAAAFVVAVASPFVCWRCACGSPANWCCWFAAKFVAVVVNRRRRAPSLSRMLSALPRPL